MKPRPPPPSTGETPTGTVLPIWRMLSSSSNASSWPEHRRRTREGLHGLAAPIPILLARGELWAACSTAAALEREAHVSYSRPARRSGAGRSASSKALMKTSLRTRASLG